MALSRGGFENQFPGINPYSAGRKPQDVSPGGSSRNPIGSGFSNNTEGSKMGFFGGMKKDGESADSADFFYGGNKTSLLQRSQSASDGGLSSHMNNLNLYGSNNSLNSMNSGFKGKENDTSSSNWSSGGWGQSGSGSGSLPFPQGGLGSTNLTNPTSRPSLNSNSLLQFSRSFSLQTGTTSQSSSDMQYQQQLKLLGSGQSSPNNSGLLSTQQQQHMHNHNNNKLSHREIPSVKCQTSQCKDILHQATHRYLPSVVVYLQTIIKYYHLQGHYRHLVCYRPHRLPFRIQEIIMASLETS